MPDVNTSLRRRSRSSSLPGHEVERPAAQVVNFSIAAQPPPSAIAAFIHATGWEAGYSSSIVAGKRSTAVSGAMSPSRAPQTLLAGTRLRKRRLGKSSIL